MSCWIGPDLFYDISVIDAHQSLSLIASGDLPETCDDELTVGISWQGMLAGRLPFSGSQILTLTVAKDGLIWTHEHHYSDGLDVPDNDEDGVTHFIETPAINDLVNQVSVNLYFEHTYPCDLRAELIAPSGEVFDLSHLRQYQSSCSSTPEEVQRIIGIIEIEPSVSFQGTWSLFVKDTAQWDEGSLYEVKIEFYGVRD